MAIPLIEVNKTGLRHDPANESHARPINYSMNLLSGLQAYNLHRIGIDARSAFSFRHFAFSPDFKVGRRLRVEAQGAAREGRFGRTG
jgi:hypothetical protein